MLAGIATAGAEESREDPAVSAIRFYQRYLSSMRHFHCRFTPSCSEYAAQAIARYGLVEGSARAADRLMRCNASAATHYARSAAGPLLDPVAGDGAPPLSPRVPPAFLPAVCEQPPAHPAPPDAGREQRAREDLDFGLALEARGDCYRAATELQRYAHGEGDARVEAWAFGRIGACFMRSSNWEDAHTAFLTSALVAPGGPMRAEAYLLAAAARFDAGDFAGAEGILEDPDAPDSGAAATAIAGLCAAARGDWTQARSQGEAAITRAGHSALAQQIAALREAFESGPSLPHRSPRFAAALSAILPGSGQAYSGRGADGIRHLLLNAALIATVVQFARDQKPGAAYVTASFAVPFYLGNILGARSAARQFNREKRLAHLCRALATLER